MSENHFFVVGIGASAGGLRALEEFFENMPADSGAAFIVIQHLSPDFKSLMKELLERRTRMPVHRVEQGMAIAPNNVYLIPPGKNLRIKEDKLQLSAQQSRKVHGAISFPIDIFFNSLAESYAERATGIILSGTGSDGTRGLQAIKDAGGAALVQDPSTAEFDGMPQSAIATGIVDRVQPPAQLAELLYEFLRLPLDTGAEVGFERDFIIDSHWLRKIADILIEHEHPDFSHYKKTTVSRRVHRRCLIMRCADLDEYINLLNNSAEERQILSNELLINVTRFFRDPTAWAYLDSMAIAPLIEQTKPEEELRFWVTACSTGEEAYSLGMLIDEAMAKQGKQLKVKIFATDLDRNALEKAATGSYPESIANDLSEERLSKYFIYRDDSYQVIRGLREMMIFAPHNLAKDAGFTRMHLVTCRNMLIYLEPELQQQVIRNIHFSLNEKGILFLGEAENLGELEPEFITVEKKWKIYQKRRNIRLPLNVKNLATHGRSSLLHSSVRVATKSHYEPMLEETLKTILGDRQSLCLIVDRDWASRSLLLDVLAPLGFTLWETHSGQIGLTLAREHQPDVIIFDRDLPGIGDREIIEQIDSAEQTLFICTSTINLSEKELAAEIALLSKPISLKKMLRLLATHFGIEWKYPERSPVGQRQKHNRPNLAEITIPPSAQLETFLSLIQQGNIDLLQRQARQLQENDPNYDSFVSYLTQLAENFQLKKLRQLIQTAIEQT